MCQFHPRPRRCPAAPGQGEAVDLSVDRIDPRPAKFMERPKKRSGSSDGDNIGSRKAKGSKYAASQCRGVPSDQGLLDVARAISAGRKGEAMEYRGLTATPNPQDAR